LGAWVGRHLELLRCTPNLLLGKWGRIVIGLLSRASLHRPMQRVFPVHAFLCGAGVPVCLRRWGCVGGTQPKRRVLP
jgi:hypothetical protein